MRFAGCRTRRRVPLWRRGLPTLALPVAMLAVGTPAARGQAATPPPLTDRIELANPSFEEDVENDGIPDRWTIPADAKVGLSSEATQGVKSARFTDGYVLASQDVYIRGLAGRQIAIRLDAKGADGASFGCQLGFFRDTGEGTKRFDYARLAWGQTLPRDFAPIRLRYTFPKTALDGRLWIAFYRTNRQGTVGLDDLVVSDQNLSADAQVRLTRLGRELGYFAARARASVRAFPAAREELTAMAAAAEQKAERGRDDGPTVLATADESLRAIAAGHAQLNRLHGRGPVCVFASQPCERLPPDAVGPDGLKAAPEVVALGQEYAAVGAVLLNTEDRPVAVTVAVDAGTAAVQDIVVRRQVFMETWYKKAATRLTDPLPLLPRDASAWRLTLAPGAVEKLFIGFRVGEGVAGSHEMTLRFSAPGGWSQNLAASLRVLPVAFPRAPRLEHLQFMYPDLEPALSHPEAAARDLAAHGVSAIEFPYIPNATFTAAGELKTDGIAASPQAQWLRLYGAHIARLAVFWEGRYKRFPIEGQADAYLPYTDDQGRLTPAFARAYGELLQAWLRFAAANGFGPERFLMLADDEPSSKADYTIAPGPEVRRTLELYRLTRQAAPGVPIAVTLSDYAMPADAAAIAREADVVMPVWPYRETLARWAPEGYSPRAAFRDTIFPDLDGLRTRKGLRIWSYRVDAGKSEDVLISARAYPIIAVAAGFTGIGTWAYNVSRGKCWDDTDGGLLDYVFVYDGAEEHPLNREVNPSGEVVVPSIRWEALRLGWQDGQVLLALTALARQRPDSALATRLEALLQTPRAWVYSPEAADVAAVRALARDMRLLYAEAAGQGR